MQATEAVAWATPALPPADGSGEAAPRGPGRLPSLGGLPGPWAARAPSLPPPRSPAGAARLPPGPQRCHSPRPRAAAAPSRLRAARLSARAGGTRRAGTCFRASVLLMMLMSLWVALLHFFRLPAEDSSGSQAFQKCRAASITRALLPAMPANLRGRPGLDWRWGWGPRSAPQGLGGLLPAVVL